jgi:hypothetical protein
LDYLTTHENLSPIRHGFSQGTPASSNTKTGHHDIAEILLKVVLNTQNKKNEKTKDEEFSK